MLDLTKNFNTNQTANPEEDTKKPQKRPPDGTPEQLGTRKKAKLARRNDGDVQSSATQNAETANDPSGFFVIDSNPADVKELLNGFGDKPGGKRAAGQSFDTPVIGTEAVTDEIEPRRKRRKAEELENGNDLAEDNQPDVETYQREFEAKVELRLKEKEQSRKQKALRKRKRESNASVEELLDAYDTGQADQGAAIPKMPAQLKRDLRRARKRQATMAGNGDAVNGDASVVPDGGADDIDECDKAV